MGAVAVIDPANNLPKRFDLEQEVVMCQLQLDLAIAAITPETFVPFSRFPSSTIDLSIVVAEGLLWSEVESILHQNSGALLKHIKILDAPYLYAKGTLPAFHKNLQKEGRKNLVFRLVFANKNGTLQDSEISEIYAKIKVDLEKKVQAEIR